MKAEKLLAVAILWVLLAVSCKQDPIFFIIATETAPIKPRIEGAPTNMVVFQRDYPDPSPGDPDKTKKVPILYVASGRLHWYAKERRGAGESRWDSSEYAIPQPGGKIISLAAAGDRLYVLSLNGHGVSTTLRYIESGGNEWKTVRCEAADYPLIQSIYADPQTARLFAGASKNDRSRATYGILYMDNSDDTNDDYPLRLLRGDTSIFSGVVYRQEEDTYYLCTRGDGIFSAREINLARGNTPSVSQLTKNNDNTFMGIIKLNDDQSTVIAVARNGGALYRVQNGSLEQISGPGENNWISTGKYTTGALALWEDYLDPGKKLLIAGIQGGLYSTAISSYSHGYVEFDLFPDGGLNVNNPRHDPGKLRSVHDNDRYTASIGKHPINHLFQVPKEIDPKMTFFASTQTAGLWSYRDRPRNGGWQWNAEE